MVERGVYHSFKETSVRRWLVSVLVIITGVLGMSCLGKLDHDQVAQQIAEAADAELDLSLQRSHPYWLLRSQPGWVGSHELELGGGPTDTGYAAIRTARFHDANAAVQAYARLTPDYIYLLYRKHMNTVVYPFDYPIPLPGDKTGAVLYEVRPPPGAVPDVEISGQVLTILAGETVLLIESINVPPEQLIPAIARVTSLAYQIASTTD